MSYTKYDYIEQYAQPIEELCKISRDYSHPKQYEALQLLAKYQLQAEQERQVMSTSVHPDDLIGNIMSGLSNRSTAKPFSAPVQRPAPEPANPRCVDVDFKSL